MHKPSQRVVVGGVPFSALTAPEATNWISDMARSATPVSIRLANAYCIALASQKPAYADLLVNNGVNLADGVPIAAVMSHRLGRHDRRAFLVRGPSLFATLIETAPFQSYFVGATTETLTEIETRLRSIGRAHTIAGKYSPPYAAVSEQLLDDIAERVTESNADIVWIGMGTPKQDFLTTALATRLHRPCIGVGAAFDFYAGAVKEAPRWLRGSGFEWMYRLFKEPSRLGYRYTVGNVQFVRALLRDKV